MPIPCSTTDPSPEVSFSLNGRFLSARVVLPARARRSPLTLQTDPPASRPEVILGESNLLPFGFLRAGDRMGRSVVKIRRGDGACGTGFLVAPDILLTNHHVLPDPASAVCAVALAHHEADPPSPPIEARLDPSSLFVTETELDFTFCGVSGLETLGAIPLERDALVIGPSEVVNIIQHPRGRPKEVALQDNRVVKADRVVLHYECDTEPGSSGSPVFDNRWRLVALHHASIVADPPTSGRKARGIDASARFLNEGIRISAIALWLETGDAEAQADPAQVARLRGLFRGRDPISGLFGAIGRRLRGRTAVELVASEAREPGELDLAFWDLHRSTRRDFSDKIDALGSVLAGMGMDLLLLPHVSGLQARALVEHLEMCHRLEYRLLPPRVRERPALAVLYRNRRGLFVDRTKDDGALRVTLSSCPARPSSLLVHPLPGFASDSVLSALATLPASADRLLIGGPRPRIERIDASFAEDEALEVFDLGRDGGFVVARALSSSSAIERVHASSEVAGALFARQRPRVGGGAAPVERRLASRGPVAVRVVFKSSGS